MPAGITPGGENVGRAYVKVLADASEIPDGIREGLDDADKDVDRKGKEHSKSYFDKWDDRMKRVSSNIDLIADRSGRLFGKGSRNNFLNFLGVSVTRTTSLLTLLPRMAGRLAEFGSDVSKAFTGGGGGFSGFLAAIATVGPLLAGAGAGLATFAVAVAAILPALAVASTLLLAVVGSLIALAGSIVFAAIAGLAALGGALGVAAFGVGILVAGIAGMSDAQKKVLKEATEPLVEGLKELGKASARGLLSNVTAQAEKLTPIIANFEPLFFKVGRAVSRTIDSMLDGMDSPEFNNFRNQMEVFIPNAVRTLGETINNVFGGLGGVFLAMRPFIRDFLNNLEEVTQEFSDWANSKSGRKEIRDFLEDAAESAKQVGDFLLKVVDLFATLFDLGGTETGNTMFESMTDNIEKLINFLEDNPDAVRDFFDDAREVAEDIGDIVVKVGELIGALDSFMGHPIVSGGLNFLIWSLDQINRLLGLMEDGLFTAGEQAEIFGDTLGDAVRDVQAFGGITRGIFTSLPALVRGGTKGIARLVAGIFSNFGEFAIRGVARLVAPFGTLIGRVMGHISNLPGRVRDLLGRLPGLALSAVTRLVAQFVGIAGKIIGHINDLPGKVRDLFHNVLDFVSGIPGRIVGFFSGLAGRILKAIGTINIGSLVDMSGIPFLGDGAVSKPWTDIPRSADGRWFGKITNGAQLRWVGEDGPEAIVPLARDLSRVDPSVRWLSAIAQGKGMAAGGVSTSKSVDASGWTIVTQGQDPETVAQEVINRLFAQNF